MPGIEGKPEMPSIPPGHEETVEVESLSPRLLAIYISPAMGKPMEERSSILAIKDMGLEGDRYANRMGAYSAARIGKPGRISDDDRQVTFISTQAIEEANEELVKQGINPFSAKETRRNLLVSLGTEELNGLVGQRFFVGGVEFEGFELCDPCTRPPTVLDRKQDGQAFQQVFQRRGGLRARIITTGQLGLNDRITYQ